MTSRATRRARRRLAGQEIGTPAAVEADDVYRPKDAPGVVIKREMLNQVGKGLSKTKRYRNIAASPLLLAYHRGALCCDAEKLWETDPRKHPMPAINAADRKDCGTKFERLWYESMGVSHGDSTIPRISGGGSRSMTEMQEEAAQEIVMLRTKMASRNYLIVEALCGFGHSLPDSLRKAGVSVHPVGTSHRIREALDDLVCAMTGRQIVPMLVPGTSRKRP